MDVQVQCAPETLQDGHRPASPVPHAGVARPTPEEPEDRAQGLPHDDPAEVVVPGQPVAEGVGQAEHPLPYWHAREHVINEIRGALGHAPPGTAGTEGPAVARKRDQTVEPAPGAAEPREPAGEGPTLQKAPKLPLYEAGQALPVPETRRLCSERLEMVAHHLVKHASDGLPRLVGGRRQGNAPASARPMPSRRAHKSGDC